MRNLLKSFSLVTAFYLFSQTAYSFSSSTSSGGNIHEQITRDALSGTISDTNLDFLVKSCQSQDTPDGDGIKEARRHFADSNFNSALGYIDREKKKALNYAGEADTDPESRARCLHHFGLMLHTVQDFYSKTNYVELQLEDARKASNPYNLDLVDWSKVPDGYSGKRTGAGLACASLSGGAGKEASSDWQKENPDSAEGKKSAGGTTYFRMARDLAVRETQRQWNSFEALIRSRYQGRADKIIVALKQSSPAAITEPE